MGNLIKVLLTYEVDGHGAAAERELGYRANHTETLLAGIQHGPNEWHARLHTVDVNPGEHEGFTNYETFMVWMHYQNDQARDSCVKQWARMYCHRENIGDLAEGQNARLALANRIEQETELGLTIDLKEGRARTDLKRLEVGLLRAALGRVNWLEIAEVFIARVMESKSSAPRTEKGAP